LYDQLPAGADAEAAAAVVVRDAVVEDMAVGVGSIGDQVVTVMPALDYSSLVLHRLLMDGRPSPSSSIDNNMYIKLYDNHIQQKMVHIHTKFRSRSSVAKSGTYKLNSEKQRLQLLQ
jgi:hypothetical protein